MTEQNDPTAFFSIRADRQDCRYRCGEAVRFSVSAAAPDGGAPSGVFRFVLDNSGSVVLSADVVDVAREPRFSVPGAGRGRQAHTMEGLPDSIRVKMTVHPEPLPFDDAEFFALCDRREDVLEARYGVRGYSIAGLGKSREDYYYYRAILGLCRAAEWAAALPQADPANVTVEGASQGGGLGLCVAGLTRCFTKALFRVPALSDILGFTAGRGTGCAPCPVRDQPKEDRLRAATGAPYFEAANFVARVACPVRFLAGFADCEVAPSAVYACYNRCRAADRGIVDGIGMGHSCTPEFSGPLHAWLYAPYPYPSARHAANGAPGPAAGTKKTTRQ